MTVPFLTNKELRYLHIEEELSDGEIARMFGMTRSAVTHRRRYNNIERDEKMTGFELALKAICNQLIFHGHKVSNEKLNGILSPFDLLVNNYLKIKVLYSALDTSFASKGARSYVFSLTSKSTNGNIVSDTRIQLPNGRFRRLYRLTCDFLICMGYNKDKNDFEFWIIPSKNIPDELQTLRLTAGGRSSKYQKYEEAWELINEKAAP